MNKKVGIMGGTFNPIHLGHLIMAEAAVETYDLDEILFIPSGTSYLKENVLDIKTRIALTGVAIEDNPKFALSTLEVDRGGNSYSYETLASLREENPETEYYFIAGADSIFQIEKWKYPEKILGNCIIIAAIREGFTREAFEAQVLFLTKKYNADIRVLPARVVDITSSNIRELVKNNQTCRYMVHQNVFDYIMKHKLYINTNEKEK